MPGEGRRARGREGGKQQALFVSGREEGLVWGHRMLLIPTLLSRDKQPPVCQSALT